MKIIIFGAGLAGLSAGIKLLEEKPEWEVTIYNMGHHIGGRATSWEDENGYHINHGFHAIFQNYKRLLALLSKASVNLKKTMVTSRSGYFYEEDSGKIHQIGSLVNFNSLKKGIKNGYTFSENLKHINFLRKNFNTIYRDNDIEQYDDICFSQWALENGADQQLVKKRFFRLSKDALFNWPHEISAYITMKSLRLMGNGKIYHVNGSYGEKIIAPIIKYFESLGGKIILYKKLTGISYNQDKITSLVLANPDPAPHNSGKEPWGKIVPIIKDSNEEIRDFDAAILAIPLDNFRELNPNDSSFWANFPNLSYLKTIATLNWQIWLKEAALPNLKTTLNGLDEPMGTVIDHKSIVEEYKNDDRFGSVLEFVGQETGFEDHSDEEIKEVVMDGFKKLPHARDIKGCGIVYEKFTRNTSNHERYLLTDPGTIGFRPSSTTNYKNLFLAGDWIRNEVDVPTMEGAVCSGYTASIQLMKKITQN